MWSRKFHRLVVFIIAAFIFYFSAMAFLSNKRETKIEVVHQAETDDKSLEGHLFALPGVQPLQFDVNRELKKIRRGVNGYEFKWPDWVDVNTIYTPYLSDEERQDALNAVHYIKNEMPSPARIIVLHTRREFTMNGVRPLTREIYELKTDHSKGCVFNYGLAECNRLEIHNSHSRSLKHVLAPEISKDEYVWDPELLVEKAADPAHSFTKANAISLSTRFMAGMDFSNWKVEHFRGTKNTRVMYDLRFFRLQENVADATITQKLLMRAFSSFANTFDFDFYIAQGSLMGYLWNGYSFPWDEDVDVHMPVQSLHRLASFNGTLFVLHEGTQERTYFLDVNPAYVNRNTEDGINAVDAKFIDTATGAALDIAGVHVLSDGWQIGNKAPAKFRHERVQTLRLARFMGSFVYVPRHFEGFIKEHYPHAYDHSYKNWQYDFDKRAWIDDNSHCQYPITLYKEFPCESGTCYEKEGYTCRHNDMSEELKKYAELHEQEVELWDTIDLDHVLENDPAAVESILNVLNTDFSHLFEDLRS